MDTPKTLSGVHMWTSEGHIGAIQFAMRNFLKEKPWNPLVICNFELALVYHCDQLPSVRYDDLLRPRLSTMELAEVSSHPSDKDSVQSTNDTALAQLVSLEGPLQNERCADGKTLLHGV